MVKKWQYVLYPDLRKFDPPDRARALEEAKNGAFDAIEIVGICLGLAITVILTRYSADEMGLAQRIGAALANFLIAVPLLAAFVGPFLVRRTRRNLSRLLPGGVRGE